MHNHFTRSNYNNVTATNKIYVPFTRTSHYGTKQIKVQASMIWNNLPLHLTQVCTLSHFYNQLKSYLISSYWIFSSCKCEGMITLSFSTLSFWYVCFDTHVLMYIFTVIFPTCARSHFELITKARSTLLIRVFLLLFIRTNKFIFFLSFAYIRRFFLLCLQVSCCFYQRCTKIHLPKNK